MNTHYIFQYLMTAIQCFVLLGYTYQTSICQPWREKKEAMAAAEQQLRIQYKSCQQIVNLSHELKTPVNVIRSALTILSMDFTEMNVNNEIIGIKKNCRHIMNIIQDMIDIQKIRGNCLQLHPCNYNMIELLENVADAFADEMYPGRIIFDTSTEEIFHEVDKDILQQGFMLLLGFLLEQEPCEVVMVEISEKEDLGKLDITLSGAGIDQLRKRAEEIMICEEKQKSQVDQILNVQLVWTIIQLLEGTIRFSTVHEKTQLGIQLYQKDRGEKVWLEDENAQYMRERIRCRYKIG